MNENKWYIINYGNSKNGLLYKNYNDAKLDAGKHLVQRVILDENWEDPDDEDWVVPTDEDAKQRPMVRVRDNCDVYWQDATLLSVSDRGCWRFAVSIDGVFGTYDKCRMRVSKKI